VVEDRHPLARFADRYPLAVLEPERVVLQAVDALDADHRVVRVQLDRRRLAGLRVDLVKR